MGPTAGGRWKSAAITVCPTDLQFPEDQLSDRKLVEKTLAENADIALVHTTHNETGTGILNPVREIGELAH